MAETLSVAQQLTLQALAGGQLAFTEVVSRMRERYEPGTLAELHQRGLVSRTNVRGVMTYMLTATGRAALGLEVANG